MCDNCDLVGFRWEYFGLTSDLRRQFMSFFSVLRLGVLGFDFLAAFGFGGYGLC